jgi:predicted porin
MKKSALALAVMAALCLGQAAQAQSNVQVYGIIDAGGEYVNHAGPGDGHEVCVVSGGKNTSRWGFRGSQELGGGLGLMATCEQINGNTTGIQYRF